MKKMFFVNKNDKECCDLNEIDKLVSALKFMRINCMRLVIQIFASYSNHFRLN